MPAPRKAQTQPRSRGTAKRLGSSSAAVGQPAAPPDGAPVLPAGYLPESYEAWTALWLEPQAAHLTGAQRMVARRWIEAVDAWFRALALVKQSPMVQGSTGQPVVNPMMGVIVSREAAMEKCERQLGIGLKNKADLGLTIGQVKLTAQQLNEMYRSGSDGSSEDAAAIGAAVEEAAAEDDGWSPAE